MRFLVQEFGGGPPRVESYPTAVLRQDNWDDYGFRTSFGVRLHLRKGRIIDIGGVKILGAEWDRGYTELPEFFTKLGTGYCSLGQAYSYYEQLQELGPTIYKPFLVGLRDVVFRQAIRKEWENHPGFEDSLLRFDGARRALEDGQMLFGSAGATEHHTVDFRYRYPGRDETVEFVLGEHETLPDRVAAVIGYNGAGKTRLLANLAQLTYADSRKAGTSEFKEQFGEFVGDRPAFGAILAVSYSAFDDFDLPTREGDSRAAERDYTYCGLRQTSGAGSDAQIAGLKVVGAA